MSDQAITQPQAALYSGYSFVMNVGCLVDGPSYTLAPGHELRRATATEAASIKEIFDKLAGTVPVHRAEFLWETSHGADGRTLLENEWRYFVISSTGSAQVPYELSLAFELVRAELEVGIAFHTTPIQGFGWNPARLVHFLEGVLWDSSFFIEVSASDAEEIQAIRSQLQNHDATLLDVRSLTGQLAQLKAFPHSSPLRFLGYFAILESILTHAPKPSDPYDSITRQVMRKLALLNHRFPRGMDYSAFGGAPEETVWKRMYGYRSQLAHGGQPQFTGEFQVLVSHNAALKLIKEAVKATIRHALSEPQLLVDLREC